MVSTDDGGLRARQDQQLHDVLEEWAGLLCSHSQVQAGFNVRLNIFSWPISQVFIIPLVLNLLFHLYKLYLKTFNIHTRFDIGQTLHECQILR